MRKSLSIALSLLLIVALSACSGASSGGKGMKAAALFTQKVNEGDFDVVGYAAFKKMADKHGWETAYAEQAAFTNAKDILRDFASRDYKLVIGHSSGYGSSVLEVAPEFPNTHFAVVSALAETKGLKNVSGWAITWNDVGYQVGLLAGYSTKAKKVGIILGDKIPAMTKLTAGFLDGVKYANPSAEVKIAWVGSFTDAAKAKQLALAQAAEGVDFIFGWANTANLGIFEAANEKKILTIGTYRDQSNLAPNVMATTILVDFDRIYDELGSMLKDGKLEPKIYDLRAASGYYKFTPIKHVPADAVKQFEAALKKIESGEIKIPLNDYKG